MRDKAILLLAALGLTFVAWGPCQAGEHPGPEAGDRRDTAASPDWSLWLPSESWLGGKQYDPRVEKRVSFWGAGMPLRDVFAGVKEQTEVEIGFWPPGDDNERICVNLYLNPEKPPTLRELMAQLRWVTDCGFALSDEGRDEPWYYLLSTSIGQGDVRQRLEEETFAAEMEQMREHEVVRAERRQRFPARLEEFEAALELSREEVIELHRGVDDLMLLALLDPRRRAVGRFALCLSEEDMARLVAGEHITRQWFEWSAEQRAWLKKTVSAEPPEWSAAAQGAWPGDAPGDWLDRAKPQINLQVTREGVYGAATVEEEVEGKVRTWDPGIAFLSLIVNDVEAEIGLRPHLQEEVMETLGEPLTREEAEELSEQHKKRRKQNWRRRRVGERLEEQRPRLGDARDLLTSLRSPVEADEGYALWQIQEAVAAASGLHVVSDCFWQPERRLDFLLGPLYPEGIPELSALDVLRLSCLAYEDRSHLVWMTWRDMRYAVGWEWGQAGPFLRFRSLNRDMWRAAVLSPDLVDAIHSWIEPYLMRDQETGRYPAVVEVPLDLRECAWVAAQLEERHWQWGCGVIYGELSDERNAYLRAFREEMLSFVLPGGRGVEVFRGLTNEQWIRLHEEGLTWRMELAPQPIRRESGWGDFGVKERDVVRLADIEPAEVEWHDDPTPPAGRVPINKEAWGNWCRLELGSGVDIHGFKDFPRTVRISPKSTERLVELPEGPASE